MDAHTLSLDLMARFADRTGLTGEHPSRRYLWTDAFAVCNFLGLARVTGDQHQEELALRLVDHVHHTLGRHRGDDGRHGWLSGLAERQGEAHPTLGGLRIGKPLPERGPGEPLDERLEWDRDGQYFHYLTKWMHALDQVTRATGQTLFNRWGCELADRAHRAFTYAPRPGAMHRMYWKLSIDLSRPLVASMGQHDPLDGLVTCLQLSAGSVAGRPSLEGAISDFADMIEGQSLASGDPLGIGGLLVDAFRLAQMEAQGIDSRGLVASLLDAGLAGLRHYAAGADLRLPAAHRLAFRELGLSIGLAACSAYDWPGTTPVRDRLARLATFASLGTDIRSFWLRPEHRQAVSWREHEDINDVMLATTLCPDGFLVLTPR